MEPSLVAYEVIANIFIITGVLMCTYPAALAVKKTILVFSDMFHRPKVKKDVIG